MPSVPSGILLREKIKRREREKNKVSQINTICFGIVRKEKAAEQFLLLHAVMWHFVYTQLLG